MSLDASAEEGLEMTEARKTFHKELEDIRQELVRISAGVVESIPKCTAILLEQDLAGAEEMIMADDEVDMRTIDLEERCIQILALQAPVAGELRQVISALKICAEIERSADLAVNICKAARRMDNLPPPLRAEVAELVDALGSGSSVCMDVGVQISPSAPLKNQRP